MFSDKENINILTSLLIAHGVRYAVVCPGSRNAPIVHNLASCGQIKCYPVTDERSAGFYALGLCQAVNSPVVVCVTSGTALLNLAPAVAEAFYQNLPLIVVSADRPLQWIDQLDGQTLPQANIFGNFVRKSVNLLEPTDEEHHWYCNRLVNEALLECVKGSCSPVHINVPITEPLYQFNVNVLPTERKIELLSVSSTDEESLKQQLSPLFNSMDKAERPLIIIGQQKPLASFTIALECLHAQQYVVLYEPLSVERGEGYIEEMMQLIGDDKTFLPDFILYIGGHLVSKRVKQFLRKTRNAECWIINSEGVLYDTFMNLHGIIQADSNAVLSALPCKGKTEWFEQWETLRQKARKHRVEFQPQYSSMLAVKQFETLINQVESECVVHYANSTSVRLGCIYAQHFVCCNRGVNGIEGSLSTAAGYSLATKQRVFCVIGDLSFFYDQNALWNQNLSGNFRILLLNNGGGGIFSKFEGLKSSPVRQQMVMAEHTTTAKGICHDNHIRYLSANNESSLEQALHALVFDKSTRPMLLEVFTDVEKEMKIYQDYFRTI